MARAQIKNTGVAKSGVQPRCGKCGVEIQPGQQRYEWHFRYGGRRVRCMSDPPKPSDLTQSEHLSNLYAAREDLEAAISSAPQTLEELTTALAELASVIDDAASRARESAEAYEQAAEHFGGAGENQERYEAADAWADEIENIDLPEPPEDENQECDDCEGSGQVNDVECATCEGTGEVDSDELQTSIEDVWQEAHDAVEAAAGALEL